MKKLKVNKIKCLSCGDIIESKSVHDYKECKCGKVAVDGGLEYASRNFPKWPPEDWFEDLSEYDEVNDNSKWLYKKYFAKEELDFANVCNSN